jgi:uncharacterized integral membrane protein
VSFKKIFKQAQNKYSVSEKMKKKFVIAGCILLAIYLVILPLFTTSNPALHYSFWVFLALLGLIIFLFLGCGILLIYYGVKSPKSSVKQTKQTPS